MNNNSFNNNNNNNMKREKSNNNVDRLKDIMRGMVPNNGSMKIDDLRFKLKRQYNTSDADIENVIKMCNAGGDDW